MAEGRGEASECRGLGYRSNALNYLLILTINWINRPTSRVPRMSSQIAGEEITTIPTSIPVRNATMDDQGYLVACRRIARKKAEDDLIASPRTTELVFRFASLNYLRPLGDSLVITVLPCWRWIRKFCRAIAIIKT